MGAFRWPDFQPSGIGLLTANMLKCAAPASVRYDPAGRSYDIWFGDTATSGMNEKQALARLLCDMRLGVGAADDLLELARSAPGRTKTAQIVFPEDDPSAGQFTMPLIDRTIPAEQATTQALPGTVTNNALQLPATTPGLDNSSFGSPRDDDMAELMAVAEQARASGQRTVLDHAVVGTLARVHDVGAVIDGMLPKMRTTLDALGRLLFLFHMKPEDWADRYGADERHEMQDQLTNLYKGLGDLSTRLEEAKIEGDPVSA